MNPQEITILPGQKKYASQFKTLELSQESDRETVRRQYINLVKKYHPDTARNGEDNIEKFHLIDEAYKELQKFFAEKDSEDRECEGEYGLYYQEKTYAQKMEMHEEDREDRECEGEYGLYYQEKTYA